MLVFPPSVNSVYGILAYARDHTTCRKQAFDSHLGNPKTGVAPFAGADKSECWQCDNCLQNGKIKPSHGEIDEEIIELLGFERNDPSLEMIVQSRFQPVAKYGLDGPVVLRNATIDAYRMCKLVEDLSLHNAGPIRFSQVADLCRRILEEEGPSANYFKYQSKPTSIKGRDIEAVLLDLILMGFLDVKKKENDDVEPSESLTYIVPGSKCRELTKFGNETEVENGDIEIHVRSIREYANH